MFAEDAHHADEPEVTAFRIADAEDLILLHPLPRGKLLDSYGGLDQTFPFQAVGVHGFSLSLVVAVDLC